MGKESTTLSRFIQNEDFTLKASSAETSSTTGPTIELGDAAAIYIKADVTAVSGGTPTMKVNIEGSDDGSDWFVIATLGANGFSVGTNSAAVTNFTAPAVSRGVAVATRYIRYSSVIGGSTPSFTYSLTGSKTTT